MGCSILTLEQLLSFEEKLEVFSRQCDQMAGCLLLLVIVCGRRQSRPRNYLNFCSSCYWIFCLFYALSPPTTMIPLSLLPLSHSLLPRYLPTYVTTYLPSYLPTYLPLYLPTYLPSYLPISTSIHPYFCPFIS